jgi:hypothetical protein
MGTSFETLGEPNIGNRQKYKKSSPPPTPPPQTSKKKTKPPNACYAFSLIAWNLYFQIYLSPFSAWANTPNIKWGHLLSIEHTYLLLLLTR